jgi:hypothetical protein
LFHLASPLIFFVAFLGIGIRFAPATSFPTFLLLFSLASAAYFYSGVSKSISNPGIWITVAIFSRLALFTLPICDDFHRYIFEGKVLAAGLNPYLLAPSDPNLAFLRGPGFNQINHPDFPAIYPPLTLGIFSLWVRISENPLFFKIGFLLAEIFCLWVLYKIPEKETANKPENRAWFWFALNPLMILESSGHAHFEALLLAGICLYLLWKKRVPQWASLGLATAILVKPQVLVLTLIPGNKRIQIHPSHATLSRSRFQSVLQIIQSLGFPLLAGLGVGLTAGPNLLRFGNEFTYNSMGPSLLVSIFPTIPREWLGWVSALGLGLTYAFLIGRGSWKYRDPIQAGLLLTGWLLFWLPTVHPWYLLWILPFAALRGHLPWLLATCTMSFAYWVYARETQTGIWSAIPWLKYPEYLPPLFLLLWQTRGTLFRMKNLP